MKRVFLKNYFRSMLLDRVCVFLALQFYVLKHEVCHRLTKIKKSVPEETSFNSPQKGSFIRVSCSSFSESAVRSTLMLGVNRGGSTGVAFY